MLDIPDENWNMFQLYGELINRRRDEKSISYVECHDQAIVGGKSSFFRMTDAEIYYNMHRNSGNNVIDRAMALLSGSGRGIPWPQPCRSVLLRSCVHRPG